MQLDILPNNNGFRVFFDEDDTDVFSAEWPGSDVEGEGYFEFDSQENLIDTHHDDSISMDTDDWKAFMTDCQASIKYFLKNP